jgi:hypothetical protein
MKTYRAFMVEDHRNILFRNQPEEKILPLLQNRFPGIRVFPDSRSTVGTNEPFEWALFETSEEKLVLVIPDPKPQEPIE